MILMRLKELAACTRHHRALVVLEDRERSRLLTFYADPEETRRLARALARGPRACHPVYDFVRALLGTLGASALRVVLDDVDGRGVGALVHLRQGQRETVVTCYPPDALALALREQLPIYATAAALDHAMPAAPSTEASGDTARWLDRVRPQDFDA
jgi:bifunctional DNase/RNase